MRDVLDELLTLDRRLHVAGTRVGAAYMNDAGRRDHLLSLVREQLEAGCECAKRFLISREALDRHARAKAACEREVKGQ